MWREKFGRDSVFRGVVARATTIALAAAVSARRATSFAPLATTTTTTLTLVGGRRVRDRCFSASVGGGDDGTVVVDDAAAATLRTRVDELKRVIFREYATFFDPMYEEWYADDVTFNDPLNDLSGVSSYRDNVDMLGGRSVLGRFLFEDAGIALHSLAGGDVSEDGSSVSNLSSRWTLRFTFRALPWRPTARFTGVSDYRLEPGGPAGVRVVGQRDYWDSINLLPNGSGEYEPVGRGAALADFLGQIAPSAALEAKQSGPELPYELLRRGDGYEVRRYPEHVVAELPYSRRDEGFGTLGAFVRGLNPLAPAVMSVPNDEETADKYMAWPIAYRPPGARAPPLEIPPSAAENAGQGQWRTTRVSVRPSRVVAVGTFDDASMGPVVRKADQELRERLARDGLAPEPGTEDGVVFAQYDAVFSMGKRRGEVWITLNEDDDDDDDGGHPW